MCAAHISKGVIVATALSAFGGCQSVGPIAIDAGRDRYNSILQSTSKQQAFENIIRVHNNEPTSFMDVTEVDATQTFTGMLSGSMTGIGARAGTSGGTLAGQVGSVTPGVSYSETPLIRYVPLVGQGLVEQTVAPVNTDALASLYDSGWDVMPLLDLALPYLTLDRDETGAAVNLIAEIDYDGNLELISTKSDWTKKPNASGDGSSKNADANNNGASKKSPTSTSTDDALLIYLLPHAGKQDWSLWRRLAQFYQGTQLPLCSNKSTMVRQDPPRHSTRSPPSGTQGCMPADAPFIELRTTPVTKFPNHFSYTAPLMRTNSALGILKAAAQPPNPRIGFVSPGDYERITHYWWNDPEHRDRLLCVYTVTRVDLKPGDEELSHATASERKNDRDKEDIEDKALERWVSNPATPRPLPYVYSRLGMSNEEFVDVNDRLWQLRRYMLIIESDAPPPANAYVAYFDRGHWYYIDGNDLISQKNFNLISLFMTVMAIPPSNAPLSTSISIGGGG